MGILFKKSILKQLFFRSFAVFFLFFYIEQQLYAGWFITEIQSDSFGNMSDQSVFIQNSKIRIENSQQAIVIDVEKNELTLIFFAKKVFWHGNADTLKQDLYHLMQQKIAQLIAQLPQSEQEKAQKELDEQLVMQNGSKEIPDLVTSFSSHDTIEIKILDYTVSAFDFFCDSTFIERIWLTDQINPFKGINKERMEQIILFFSPPTAINLCRSSEGYKNFVKNKFVLKSEIITPYGKSITEVSQIRNMNIPEHIFDPPESYRSILIEELGMLVFDDNTPTELQSEPFQNTFENKRFDDW